MIFERNENLKEYIKTYPVTSLFLLINVAVFIFIHFNGGTTDTQTLAKYGAFYKPFIKEGEYYRFVTSIFIHIGFQHLLFNMFSLFVFSSALEKITGSVRYTVIYLLSGIGGGVFVYLFSINAIVAGASGSIFGVFGAFIALIIKGNESIDQTTKKMLMVLFAIDILYTFFGNGISIAGHLGGLTIGFITAYVLIKKRAE